MAVPRAGRALEFSAQEVVVVEEERDIRLWGQCMGIDQGLEAVFAVRVGVGTGLCRLVA